MPFRSQSQRKWMFSQHPQMAKRWAAHTPDIKSLPERVRKKKRKRKRKKKAREERTAPNPLSRLLRYGRWLVLHSGEAGINNQPLRILLEGLENGMTALDASARALPHKSAAQRVTWLRALIRHAQHHQESR